MLKKKILICDDARFMRNYLKDIVEAEGYEVIGEAINGQTVIDLYKELKPDIVLMDITMPLKSGIEAVEDIISFDPNAKIIMCSAMGQDIMVIEALKAGAVDFIVKPFQAKSIIEAINKV